LEKEKRPGRTLSVRGEAWPSAWKTTPEKRQQAKRINRNGKWADQNRRKATANAERFSSTGY
jgi:hypothetical protein